MKPLTIAVDIAWKLAVWEASAANSEFIEKEHAVVGLLSLEKVAAGKPDDMKLNREQLNIVRAECYRYCIDWANSDMYRSFPVKQK